MCMLACNDSCCANAVTAVLAHIMIMVACNHDHADVLHCRALLWSFWQIVFMLTHRTVMLWCIHHPARTQPQHGDPTRQILTP